MSLPAVLPRPKRKRRRLRYRVVWVPSPDPAKGEEIAIRFLDRITTP